MINAHEEEKTRIEKEASDRRVAIAEQEASRKINRNIKTASNLINTTVNVGNVLAAQIKQNSKNEEEGAKKASKMHDSSGWWE